jgi:hypothetical protein
MSIEGRLDGRQGAHRPRWERALYETARWITGASRPGSGRPLRRLVLYPPLARTDRLADTLNRLAWGLSSHPPEGVQVEVACLSVEEMSRVDLRGLAVPASHENYLSREDFSRQLRWIDAERAAESLAGADLLLVWDARALRQPAVLVHADKVVVMDPAYFRDAEASNVAGLLSRLLGRRARLEARAASAGKYGSWLERFKGVHDAYVFFTGPSLEAGLQRPLIEGSVRLICNSLARNGEVVERICPDGMVFLDPAYHMGVSRYSAEFRSSVARVLAELPSCVCIVPEDFAPLLCRELAAEVCDRIIGMPVVDAKGFNFPTCESFFVRRTGNVLTQLMVPVATSLATRIHIVGADGRQRGDRGFWRHLPAAQFGDLLSTIDGAHPSLARDTDHERYYREHCRVTARLLKEGEGRYGKVYLSETPSYIPALAARSAAG